MNKLIYFKDGNGFIDTVNRSVGRWVWTDNYPFPEWILQPAYLWTVTELYGAQGEEWNIICDISTPNPHIRSVEQRIASDLLWSKLAPDQWRRGKEAHAGLPKRKVA